MNKIVFIAALFGASHILAMQVPAAPQPARRLVVRSADEVRSAWTNVLNELTVAQSLQPGDREVYEIAVTRDEADPQKAYAQLKSAWTILADNAQGVGEVPLFTLRQPAPAQAAQGLPRTSLEVRRGGLLWLVRESPIKLPEARVTALIAIPQGEIMSAQSDDAIDRVEAALLTELRAASIAHIERNAETINQHFFDEAIALDVKLVDSETLLARAAAAQNLSELYAVGESIVLSIAGREVDLEEHGICPSCSEKIKPEAFGLLKVCGGGHAFHEHCFERGRIRTFGCFTCRARSGHFAPVAPARNAAPLQRVPPQQGNNVFAVDIFGFPLPLAGAARPLVPLLPARAPVRVGFNPAETRALPVRKARMRWMLANFYQCASFPRAIADLARDLRDASTQASLDRAENGLVMALKPWVDNLVDSAPDHLMAWQRVYPQVDEVMFTRLLLGLEVIRSRDLKGLFLCGEKLREVCQDFRAIDVRPKCDRCRNILTSSHALAQMRVCCGDPVHAYCDPCFEDYRFRRAVGIGMEGCPRCLDRSGDFNL